jgi:hypothetical protein
MGFQEEQRKARDERQRWVASLAVGDVVGIETVVSGAEYTYTKTTVRRLTPNGKVRVVEQDALFDKSGEHRMDSRFSRSHYKLVPWTEDIEKLMARRKLVQSVDFYLDRSTTSRKSVQDASDEDLVVLLNILRKFRRDPTY